MAQTCNASPLLVISRSCSPATARQIDYALVNGFEEVALGYIAQYVIATVPVQRMVIAGGDTSAVVARALGSKAVEMIAPLSPGAPLCRAFAPNSAADGLEVVFKGGQAGGKIILKWLEGGKFDG